MRGLRSIFFGSGLAADEMSTALVVCSGDAVHCPQILSHVRQRFPKAQLTYVAPQEYVQFLPQGADVRLISELKKATLQTSKEIRARKYDITVLMLTGQSIFRKAKLWALFTNYRMLLVYNENIDSFVCCRNAWSY